MYNSLTHCRKSVHLNAGKDCNIPPSAGRRNSPRFFFFAYLIRAVCVRPLYQGRRQADNPFPSISAAARHHRFPRWQRWSFYEYTAQAVERQISLRIPTRKYGLALSSAIVVASEAAPGLLRSYFRPSVGVNANGSCHRAQPPVPENSAFDSENCTGNLKNYTHISPSFFSYSFRAFWITIFIEVLTNTQYVIH